MKRRTRAARIPSVIFAAVFLAVCYIAGTIVLGRDAGIAALLLASVMAFHIGFSISGSILLRAYHTQHLCRNRTVAHADKGDVTHKR